MTRQFPGGRERLAGRCENLTARCWCFVLFGWHSFERPPQGVSIAPTGKPGAGHAGGRGPLNRYYKFPRVFALLSMR